MIDHVLSADVFLHVYQCRSFDRNDAADVDWIHRVKFEKLSTIFRHILLQTISCLDDDRWEVRRMSQQVCHVVLDSLKTQMNCWGLSSMDQTLNLMTRMTRRCLPLPPSSPGFV